MYVKKQFPLKYAIFFWGGGGLEIKWLLAMVMARTRLFHIGKLKSNTAGQVIAIIYRQQGKTCHECSRSVPG